MKHLYFFIFICFSTIASAQDFITRDIKSFGAKGDGKTNDHVAFENASAFFNKRGGNGKLVISKGTYLVGKQSFAGGKKGKRAYIGNDVLNFKNVSKLTITGTRSSKIKFIDKLKFGAFEPTTGKAFKHNTRDFVNEEWAAHIGSCIILTDSKDVTISTLEMDGNNEKISLGGDYGDVGRQLPHIGIYITNSKNIAIQNVNVHHFGLDGMLISNIATDTPDSITISDSRFEYNSRQGLSWVGGNQLLVKGCSFNYTGRGSFVSAPGAGVDIEAEVGPVRNGRFVDCEFKDNAGVALVADAGDSGDCVFENSTFWGVTTWSLWITKPGFTFHKCNFYGSVVHGFNAANDKEATKFYDCVFEDKMYKGKPTYGGYLLESNNARRMSFTGCTFITHEKKIMWTIQSKDTKAAENYFFNNCNFIINNKNKVVENFIANTLGITYINCRFEFKNKLAKSNGYFFNNLADKSNIDKGGNIFIYP